MDKIINIVVPMAGGGASFQQAGYTFPKPLIDVNGKPMIQMVVENLKPTVPHKFIFICMKEHYDKYSLNEIFNNIVGRENYECIQLVSKTMGAACTVLTTVEYINNDNDLIVANSDQIIDVKIDDFIGFARESQADGAIMTFEASHPRWSYARVNGDGDILEVAEKKVISNHATVGLYYFKEGKKFVAAAHNMIEKGISINDEYYVCPVYNELILEGGSAKIWEIPREKMHSLGTPEDLNNYLRKLESVHQLNINC